MNIIKQLQKKYNNIPLPAKASFWFVICSFFQKSISMITMPIFTRIMTTEQFGVYTVYQSWYTVISIFATLNLSAGVFYNGMIKYKNSRNSYISAMQGLSTTVTIILYIIYIIGHNFFNRILGLSELLVTVMFLELLFVPAYQLWTTRQRFDYRYKSIIAVTSLIAFMSPVIGIIAVLSTDYKAEARILSYVGVQIAVGIIIYIYNIYRGRKIFVKEYWKFALLFNIPLIPHYLSMSVLGQSDRIMISKMIGNSEAAIYGVAYNISLLMNMVTTAIHNSFNPYSYKAISECKYADIGKIANILLVLVGSLVVCMACFGPEVIRLFAAKPYYNARWVIPPVSLSVFFMFLYPLFSNIEFYFEANKFVTFASVIGAMVNIVLNYIFIPLFGFIAAGYTTLFCYILFVIGHYYFHIKVLNNKLSGIRIYNIKFIALFSALLIIFVLSMTFIYDILLLRYAIIFILMIILFTKRKIFIDGLKHTKNSD